jgi:hypothetical protein
MLSLLVTLVVALIVLALAWYVITTLLPLPEPIGKVARVVFVVIGVLILIWFLLALVGQAPSSLGRL